MPRYPHIIAPATGGKWPSRVLIVDTVGMGLHANATDRKVVDRLSRWHVRGAVKNGNGYRLAYMKNGDSAAQFWYDLNMMQHSGGSIWIFSYQCSAVWGMLRLWEGIENGEVVIVGHDSQTATDSPEHIKELRKAQTDPLASISSGDYHKSVARKQGLLVVADPPCIATFKLLQGGSRITWVDVRNYGVSLPVDIPAGPQTVEYLENWFGSYEHACRTLNFGSLQTTIGSQALHAWKVGYYVGGVYCGGKGEANGVACAAYYGGRCEAVSLGRLQHGCWVHDVRSSYAFHATSARIPQWHDHSLQYPSVNAAKQCCQLYTCCAEVALETDEPAYPCRRSVNGLPEVTGGSPANPALHGGGGTDVIYPIGRFCTVLMGPELEDALFMGRVKSINRLEAYHPFPVLKDFALAAYQLRCAAEIAGDKALTQTAKAMLVAFVGKWGQREKKWVHIPDTWTDLLYGEWWAPNELGIPSRYRSLGGVVQREEIGGLSTDAVPSIAAYITAAARIHLLNLIRVAGWENVYYYDTDSLFTNDTGHAALKAAGSIQDCTLGTLQTRALYDDVEIRGIKYYVADGDVVCAGLPRDRCEDAGDGEHYWYYANPAEQARMGERPQAVRTLHRYHRGSNYRHGVRQPGGRVTPIELREW